MKEKVTKAVPLLLIVVLLVSTFIAWRITQREVEDEVEKNFNYEVQIAKHWMQDRLNLYLPITLGIRIFFEAGDGVTANQWSTYVKRLELISKYPAISSISYIERVSGQNEDDYVVKFVESHNEQKDTIGLNLSTDQKQLELLNSVRDEDPTSTGRVTLIIAPEKGFEIILPVYNKGPVPITIEERRQALKGFVRVQFAGDKLFQDIFNLVSSLDLDFEVYSGLPNEENLLYGQSQPLTFSNPDYKPKVMTRETFEFNGQTWYLVVTNKPNFRLTPSQERLPYIVLGSGVALSLIFLSIYLFMLKNNTPKDYKNKEN
ncbi:MAG: CHASE domain-containing protein [Patescibacteria group bacterium]